jgi:hypothetical protein
MTNPITAPGHGAIGGSGNLFTRLLDPRGGRYNPADLLELSIMMKGEPDKVKDGADPEENLWVPAGYTYLGQFIDHDLTFDSTSSLNPQDAAADGTRQPTNLRTPRFDLDCLYGDGPDAQPFMYGDDGATLLYGGSGLPTHEVSPNGAIIAETPSWDLLRAPNGRAIIGDKRNDENSIVSQIQYGFVRFHNAVVQRLKDEGVEGSDLFTKARNHVRWTYQRIILEDFLPRIIKDEVLADLKNKTRKEREGRYALYKEGKMRKNLPREFVAAAYRFGHSGVRTGYRLNRHTKLSIFPDSDHTDQQADSLIGFEPLPKHHVIDDWKRFFPDSAPGADIGRTDRVLAGDKPNPTVQLQYAYKLDPTLVDPLGVLPPRIAGGDATIQAKDQIKPAKLPNLDRPSLALLNLLRGNSYGLPSGQAVANALQDAGLTVTALTANELVIRAPTDDVPTGGKPKMTQAFKWTTINEKFLNDTPLWFYVLAEAQAQIVHAIQGDSKRVFLETQLLNGPGALSQLGWVGGRIVAEVFYGILDEDSDSIFNHKDANGWKPFIEEHNDSLRMLDLLNFR